MGDKKIDTTTPDAVAGRLAGDIGVGVFNDLCNPDTSSLLLGGREWESVPEHLG